ncbi:type I restriction enzyme endonuclease domain-containing protein [Streptomyces sp. NPDC052701]|uniref:type I restriction enzyme endonuclease domain-containing protein n=1 Tax=Streptomyces sp. NPDC052701 TaxID=3155533 RepID=UPI0034154A4E
MDRREFASHDAVADHGTARPVRGDEVLAGIARELVAEVRSKLKPGWIAREPVRARLRSSIERLLARRNYPPDRAPGAIDLVLKQMEHFADEWSTTGLPDDWHTRSAHPSSTLRPGSGPPLPGRSRFPARRVDEVPPSGPGPPVAAAA